jgi:hypothetical protein
MKGVENFAKVIHFCRTGWFLNGMGSWGKREVQNNQVLSITEAVE